MPRLQLPVSYSDTRGQILDLISDHIDAVTLITFVKNAVRANHWHKETVQWNFVIEGTVLYKAVDQTGNSEEILLSSGDLVKTDPGVTHALKGISDSARIVVFTKGPRSGQNYESDTFRIDKPILE